MSKPYQYECPYCHKVIRGFTWHECIDDRGRRRRIIKGIVKQSKSSKWHRVEDELPVCGHDVLAIYNNSVTIVAWFTPENNWRAGPSNCQLDTVTHWRELPKPPKKGK